MKPIALFFHCIFSGGSAPIDTGHACRIVAEQMKGVRESGLADAADQITVGVNGPPGDADLARLFVPPKAAFFPHGAGATTEIPTLNLLKAWAAKHPGWYVLYFHTKGAMRPPEPLWTNWRRCMQMACVWQWRRCVSDLDAGAEAVGCHWLTPQRHGHMVKRHFAGTFWWAKTDFLNILPDLVAPTWPNRFYAEQWIGLGQRLPWIIDYHPVQHWYAGKWDCTSKLAP